MANYSLRNNYLSADPNDRIAQIEGTKSFSLDDIISRILERGNTLTKADLLAAIDVFIDEIGIITREGNTINTPLFNTSLSISGVFTNDNDTFDPARHKLNINLTAGTALKKCLSDVKLTKVQNSGTAPMLTGIRDVYVEGSATLKENTLVEITGSRLKFDKTDTEQGVFFISGTTEIRLDRIADIKPTYIRAQLPAELKGGEYTVEVRTKTIGRSEKSSKTIKKGAYANSVVVTA